MQYGYEAYEVADGDFEDLPPVAVKERQNNTVSDFLSDIERNTNLERVKDAELQRRHQAKTEHEKKVERDKKLLEEQRFKAEQEKRRTLKREKRRV